MSNPKQNIFKKYTITTATVLGLTLGLGYYFANNDGHQENSVELKENTPSKIDNFESPKDTEKSENTATQTEKSDTMPETIDFDTYSLTNTKLDLTENATWQPFFDEYTKHINKGDGDTLYKYLKDHFSAYYTKGTTGKELLANLKATQSTYDVKNPYFEMTVIGAVKQENSYYVGVQEKLYDKGETDMVESSVVYYLFVPDESKFGYNVENFALSEDLTEEVQPKKENITLE